MHTKFGKRSSALCHFLPSLFLKFFLCESFSIFRKNKYILGVNARPAELGKLHFPPQRSQTGSSRSLALQATSRVVPTAYTRMCRFWLPKNSGSVSLISVRGRPFFRAFSHFKRTRCWVFAVVSSCHVCTWKLWIEIRFWMHSASWATWKGREYSTDNEDPVAIAYGNRICFIKILTVFCLSMKFQNYLNMNPQ